MTRNLIILKAVSGAGKTTFCDLIKGPKVVCCADDYFYDIYGNYNFDATKLGHAHAHCRDTFDDAVESIEVENIIIANTNTKPADYAYYVNQATKAGFVITFVVLEKRHENENVHNVPLQVLERQAANIKQNLKLM